MQQIGEMSAMKEIRTVDAVGQVLCHDITQIVRGVTKNARFRKGHVIREEDVPVLLSLGKDHIYVWDEDATEMHENEAADVLRELCQNEHMTATARRRARSSSSRTATVYSRSMKTALMRSMSSRMSRSRRSRRTCRSRRA